MKGYRVGLGFDVHRLLKAKKDLLLGGVKIPSLFSLKAVSDGDVLLHAISDALCGAGCLGDIGDYFPPDSPKSRNISSKLILDAVLTKLKKRYKLVSIDIIVVADKPRLVKHKIKILKSLRKMLSIKDINLKIKSKEGLNILGSKNSISCLALSLVKKK